MNLAALIERRPFTPPPDWRMHAPRLITSTPEAHEQVRQIGTSNAERKARNRAAVLAAIETAPAMASEIAGVAGLATPTVNRILRGLVDEGLVAMTPENGIRMYVVKK